MASEMSQMKRKDRSRNNKYRANIIAEQMDVVHERATTNAEEEDRISNLPNGIIHHILSFIDMKYAIQTSTLSKKWKNIWTSMPHLNLNSRTFRTSPRFAKFVNDALSHRNHRTKVSALELSFIGAPTEFSAVVTSIANYAYSHNVRQLTLIWFRLSDEVLKFPQRLFSSHTLKHLTLATHYFNGYGLSVPESAWEFPALETLNLSNMRFGGGIGDHKSFNLFSKCVNLKDLTLHHCSMCYVNAFNVCAQQLSNLTITDPFEHPKVLNVVAPKLESLTTSVLDIYSSFMPLSTEDLDSLEKVNLSMRQPIREKERYAHILVDLFQKLRCAKFLTLDKGIIEVLSACLDQLSNDPCPFNNLKCLKQNDPTSTVPTQVRNYLLESSPTATFIINLPQVPHKRSREEADKGTTTNKVLHKRSRHKAKNDTVANTLDKEKHQTKNVDEEKRMLEAKLVKQDEVIAEQNAMLDAMKLQHEKKMLEAKIQMQDELIAQQKKAMHENGRLQEKIQMQDKMIAEQKAMLEMMKLQNEKRMSEAKILRQERIIAEQKAMLEAMKLQHEKIEIELGNIDN